ncbi:DJ-1/PfpI family protein [Mesorhizobium sp.]|uniref:DJ-1/PfpI family protein n=1 Tax=Mesorhizobium sp. TaxID=1871066 RepID=UPI0025F36F74|nr:DJ-1/PfpI family protein [Mesorhizobium sp.]
MPATIGILLFDAAEELDFVGPWEVLTAAASPDDRVLTVAASLQPILCEKGMRVLPDVTFETAPVLDVVLVPGGSGARRVPHEPTAAWLRLAATRCRWLTSVCTGSFLLANCGLVTGSKITTHHRFLKDLRALGTSEVIAGQRFVRDGNVVTAAGVISGIEMALWLAGEVFGAKAMEDARDYIAYDWPPR